jgi:pimeloyl-ACP methyl ester carboxylesterase
MLKSLLRLFNPASLSFLALVNFLHGFSASLEALPAPSMKTYFDVKLNDGSLVQIFEPSDRAEIKGNILFLHGFPSLSRRNEDLITEAVTTFGYRVHLLHFRGLWQYEKTKSFISSEGPESFRFADSISEASEVLRIILERHGTALLLAHSWGAYVALNLLKESQAKKLSGVGLIAPYSLKLASHARDDLMNTSARALFDASSHDEKFIQEEIRRLTQSWEQAHDDHRHPARFLEPPSNLAGTVSGMPIFIAAGEIDEVIDLKSAQQLVVALRSGRAHVTYSQLPQNHWFDAGDPKRTQVIRSCMDWLKTVSIR